MNLQNQFYEHLTPAERRLRAFKVPTRYLSVTKDDWKPLSSNLASFMIQMSHANKIEPVSVARQRTTLETLFTDPKALSRPLVIGIGSIPTEDMAMRLAVSLLASADSQGMRCTCHSVRDFPDQNSQCRHDLVIMHNLFASANTMRSQVCRDWLGVLDASIRVVVIGGGDPFEFFHAKLSMPLDYGLFLRDVETTVDWKGDVNAHD